MEEGSSPLGPGEPEDAQAMGERTREGVEEERKGTEDGRYARRPRWRPRRGSRKSRTIGTLFRISRPEGEGIPPPSGRRHADGIGLPDGSGTAAFTGLNCFHVV